MRAFTVSLAAGLVLLVGCDSTVDPLPEEPLVPLALGNTWSYQGWSLGGAFIDSFTVSITDELALPYEGGTLRAFVETTQVRGLPDPEPWRWLRGNGPGGYYTLGGVAETDTLAVRLLNYHYPAEVGETWPHMRLTYRLSSTQDFAVIDTLEMRLVAKDEPFETLAGTFRCHVYKFSFLPADDVAEKWDVYEYYTPEVGRIAEVVRGQSDERLIQKSVLYDYRVQ